MRKIYGFSKIAVISATDYIGIDISRILASGEVCQCAGRLKLVCLHQNLPDHPHLPSLKPANENPLCSLKDKNWFDEEVPFHLPYQSELTHIMAKEILETGSSQLTSFDESFALHSPLLVALSKHVEKIENRTCQYCPIT